MAGPTDNLARAQRRIELCRNNLYKQLDLSRLGLRSIPDSVRALGHLHSLDVSHNALTALPDWLADAQALQVLDVSDNPALDLPAEIVADNDARKIVRYYFAASQSEPLNEFKLVLVGRGGVGKTSLVHKLTTNKYKRFKRTPGIQITQWPIALEGDAVRAHVWDFGGQEIMHGTHRLFMTERALYVVVLSGREGTEDHDADYWLSLVRSFAGDVPVIVLLHKWSDYRFQINRGLLEEKYGPGLVFLETDSETGHGVRALREQIEHLATRLPSLRAAWPKAWRQVKDELPAQEANYLTFDDFRSFCAARGVVNPQTQETLADSLHDLGLMLSYRRERALQDFGLLNPQWATRGIYDVLNSSEVRKAEGLFTPKTLAEVLPKRAYPDGVHRYLLNLMVKFRICYPLFERGDKHLIPELLSKEEPALDAEFAPDACLNFTYAYKSVMPEGLIARFLVDTYVHVDPTYLWRTGAVLERGACRALVRGDVQGRTVSIRVTGEPEARRELLGIVREHFERIHRSYARLEVEELVPIPGHPEAVVKGATLLLFEKRGQKEMPVAVGDDVASVQVTPLLDGVDLPDVPRGADRNRNLEPSRRKPLRMFIAYSRDDLRYVTELDLHLTGHVRQESIVIWFDRRLQVGQEWEPEVRGELERADIVAFLVTSRFLQSDYCMTKELPRAIERARAGECDVFPIIVEECRWDLTPITQYQAAMKDDRPIDAHRKRGPAWIEVTRRLDPVIARVRARKRGRATLEASSDGT